MNHPMNSELIRSFQAPSKQQQQLEEQQVTSEMRRPGIFQQCGQCKNGAPFVVES